MTLSPVPVAAGLLLALLLISTPPSARADGPRELIRDPHFHGGFVLLAPTPGKVTPYGNLPATDPAEPCAWRLAQWGTKYPLAAEPGEMLPGGAVRFGNVAKALIFGRPGSTDADLTFAVYASAEYTHARRQNEPWVHLLIEQAFTDPPSLQGIASARYRLSVKLLQSRLHRTADYNPGVNAAQMLSYLTVQNLNQKSPGYGDFLWFGIPLYDDRMRISDPCMILDAFTNKFIYTPDGGVYTSQSAHDREWVHIDRDILPIILHGLRTAWGHGHLAGSHDLADYRIAAVSLGWEVPGTFDVACQARDFSLQVTPGKPPVAGEPPSKLVQNLKAGKPQTVVCFGTSLTHGGAWVGELQEALNAKWPGLAHVINGGEGAQYSTWWLAHLQERVLAHRPDTVLFESAINDAYTPYATSVEQARANLGEIVRRILAQNPDCEIILQVMNPPTGEHLTIRPNYRAYYEMWRDFAAEHGLRLIDHSLNWYVIQCTDGTKLQRYMPDGIHPSEEGCKTVVTPELVRALGVEGK